MAVELEIKVMDEIGLGSVVGYSYFNGSGSCGYIRADAVNKLKKVAEKNGLKISPNWMQRCHEALTVDECDGGKYSLTNTWITCSYAIQDAIYRKDGGVGFNPPPLKDGWSFFSENGKIIYQNSGKGFHMKKFNGFFYDE